MNSPPIHTCTVTPYPLAPHLENCIIDIGRDTQCDLSRKGRDLENGAFNGKRLGGRHRWGTKLALLAASPCQSNKNDALTQIGVHAGGANTVSQSVSSSPASRILRPSGVINSVSTAKHAKKVAAPVPLSIVTNFARVPGPPRKHVQYKGQSENVETPIRFFGARSRSSCDRRAKSGGRSPAACDLDQCPGYYRKLAYSCYFSRFGP
ncbi:hypothetical protein C8R43DRAFT_1030481 [Mycena crocata]|nr:hypothetical protein C8R43DRAFT_1030481 [Mycena crocata]